MTERDIPFIVGTGRLVPPIPLSPEMEEDAFAVLDRAFAAGIRMLDTARAYPSEPVVGRWLTARGLHGKITIITKAGHPEHLPPGSGADFGPNRVTPRDITADIGTSLETLRADKLDILLVHRDDPAVPVAEIVDVLAAQMEAGRIGAYGFSNWTHERVADAIAHARANGRPEAAFSSVQLGLFPPQRPPWPGCVSIAGREGAGARAWYAATKLHVLAWSPLGGGLLSDRLKRAVVDGVPFDDDARARLGYFDRLCLDVYDTEDNRKRLVRLKKTANDLGMTPSQAALAYVRSLGLVVTPILGCKSASSLADDIGQSSARLDPEQVAWLEGDG